MNTSKTLSLICICLLISGLVLKPAVTMGTTNQPSSAQARKSSFLPKPMYYGRCTKVSASTEHSNDQSSSILSGEVMLTSSPVKIDGCTIIFSFFVVAVFELFFVFLIFPKW